VANVAFIAHSLCGAPVLQIRDQLNLHEVDMTHADSMSNIHKLFVIPYYWTMPADEEACLDIGSVVDIKAYSGL
jgi:hypothetical protein